MATSQTLRNWYPDLVVGGVDSSWNVTGTKPVCDYSKCAVVVFLASPALGGTIKLKVHPAGFEAFSALSVVFQAWGYEFRELAGGTVSCRKITGGKRTSPHAHGVALDINPSKNRYVRTILKGLIQWGRQTDMPKAMVEAVEAIRTKNGVRVFQWGGRWNTIKDPMHFQLNCSQGDLRHGIDWKTVAPGQSLNPLPTPTDPTDEGNDDMITLTTPYTKGKDVAYWQVKLKAYVDSSLKVDGVFGPVSAAAVVKERKVLGLEEVGVIDMTFASAFMNAHLPQGDFAPKIHTHGDLASKTHTHTFKGTTT